MKTLRNGEIVDMRPEEEAEFEAFRAANRALDTAQPAPKSAAAQLVEQIKADPEALAALADAVAKV